ncbi:MAG: 30S ribosomal protein S8 [Gammaproteobacteria bacterium]|nr:30S ribosomal protein S8 [Gammaproteobacteria bacterium]
MSMQDPIADFLTRIRNGQMAGKVEVVMPLSKVKEAVCKVLIDEGYVLGCETVGEEKKPQLKVALKYFEGKPVIEKITRVSRPGLRVFKGKDEIPVTNGGLGVAILSTNKGIVSDRAARQLGVGGEVLCTVS